MATILNPYLNFRDTARAAAEFYQSILGGELTISTFGEFGMAEDPAEANKVMHAQLSTEGGIVIMMSDLPAHMEYTPGSAISVSISGEDTAEVQRYWDGFSEGATIIEPFVTAPWGDLFGMLTDKFGINWLFNSGPSNEK